MTPAEIKAWLHAIGVTKLGDQGSDWLNASCPLAAWEHAKGVDNTPSFGVKIEPGESRVYCFSCQFAGDQSRVLMEMEANDVEIDYQEAWNLIWVAEDGAELEIPGEGYEEDVHSGKEVQHVYPEEMLTEATEAAYAEGQVHPYLHKRGVTFEVAQRWDLRLDVYRKRLVVPVRDFQGRLRGLHGRHTGGAFAADDIKKNYKMYPSGGQTNPHIWLGEHLIDLERPILMPEAMFDLFWCNQLYDNVVSPLTASMSELKILRLSGAVLIVTFFDGDKAGQLARRRLRKYLPDTPIEHIYPEEGVDADETDLDTVWEYLQETSLLS